MSADRTDPQGRVVRHHEVGRGTARVGYPIGVRRLSVVRRSQLTPGLLRLTVGGPELDGFHTYQADDHVRIVLADEDGVVRAPTPNDQDELDWPRPFPPSRKYTVREFRPDVRELDLDFVLHPGGLASTWAQNAKIGDSVVVAGPPGAVAFPQHHAHYVFAVDPTALPAVARWIDESPSDVQALVIVDSAERHYPLARRDGIEVVWLDGGELADAVMALDLPEDTFVFAAGDADAIKPLRSWCRGRFDALITGYWKRGVTDLDED